MNEFWNVVFTFFNFCCHSLSLQKSCSWSRDRCGGLALGLETQVSKSWSWSWSRDQTVKVTRSRSWSRDPSVKVLVLVSRPKCQGLGLGLGLETKLSRWQGLGLGLETQVSRSRSWSRGILQILVNKTVCISSFWWSCLRSYYFSFTASGLEWI